jgi:O-antigen/teichoic acid export membrane protein
MQMLMEETSELTANERLRGVETAPRANSWLWSALLAIPPPAKLIPVAYSFADQAMVIGGGFLVNVALARTQTKREYGIFALTYSVFIFLSSLHNAAILEPFTVYGSGRYRERFSEYLRLMVCSNALIGLLLSGILLLTCLLLSRIAPQLMSGALVGLGLTVGVLLSGIFLRRAFYVQR